MPNPKKANDLHVVDAEIAESRKATGRYHLPSGGAIRAAVWLMHGRDADEAASVFVKTSDEDLVDTLCVYTQAKPPTDTIDHIHMQRLVVSSYHSIIDSDIAHSVRVLADKRAMKSRCLHRKTVNR